ncbi:MAG: protein kinase [Archangium sp.]|nr:protein kinase [Archangium sp.]
MGEVIGKYELLERLSSDGVVEVFRARASDAQREVIIKRTFDDALFSEAKLSLPLAHGNVVKLLEVGQENGRSFLAAEFIDALSLGEVLSFVERVEAPVTVAIVIEVLRGLHHAHTRTPPVVHRGVSPDSVLLARDGQVKIGDFGVERGSSFWSPEQRSAEGLDARADVYACGMVLRQCIPERLIDAELAGLLKSATEPDREHRTASAQQFASGLQKWLDRQNAPRAEMAISQLVSMALRRKLSAQPPEPEPAPAPIVERVAPPAEPKRRSAKLLIALGVLGGLLIGASVALVINARSSLVNDPDVIPFIPVKPAAKAPEVVPEGPITAVPTTPVETKESLPSLPRTASGAPAAFKLSSAVHGTDVTHLGQSIEVPVGKGALRLISTSKTMMLFVAPVRSADGSAGAIERGAVTAFNGTTPLSAPSRVFLAQPTGWTSFDNLDLDLAWTENGKPKTRKIPRALIDSMTFLENAFRLEELNPRKRYRVNIGAGSSTVLVVADAPSIQKHLRTGEPVLSGVGPPWQRVVTGDGFIEVRGAASLRFSVLTWPDQREELVGVTVNESNSKTALGEPGAISAPRSFDKLKDADTVQQCQARAETLIKAGDGKAAMPYLDKCLDLQPGNTKCATLLGKAMTLR